MVAISNFYVPNRNSKGIEESDFEIFEMNFVAQKFQIAIEFQDLRCRFCIFPSFDVPIFYFIFSVIQIFENLIEISKFGRVEFCIFIPF